ncbi:MAG: hypothetical protein SFU99_13170 [Saprospiraceae bacterium]|nr:hypothetical protein [Saprospiraceae bacterium]
MTLGTLILIIAAIALVITVLVGFGYKGHKNWLLTFLQNFCGSLFIFSGGVKAIDPLGTAYKMEQYFAEFEKTFEGTWFSFLAPLFPRLSEIAPTFSTIMIVLEVVVGLALILGARNKLTSWVFLIIVAFFTFLTGFTYLTGYVPDGVNFFQFGKWGPYVETNMKVTDCGCFGDFLKLKPKVSFLKDVFLMVPALFFVFKHKDMHQLLTTVGRTTLLSVAGIGTVLFCISNYVWNEPVIDFRPFKEGVNIVERKKAEDEAAANVEVTGYKLKNKSSGKVIELPYDQFLKEFKNYPSEEWEYEQIKSAPTIERTKISDFDLQNFEGNSVTEQILSDSNYSFLIVSHKLYGKTAGIETFTVSDTLYAVDTVVTGKTVSYVQRLDSVINRQVEKEKFEWESEFLSAWKDIVNPMLQSAKKDALQVYAVTAFEKPEKIQDFQDASESDYPIFVADDILLKTIIRSNPGIILLKNGTVVQKWHYKKLPAYEEIKSKYLK